MQHHTRSATRAAFLFITLLALSTLDAVNARAQEPAPKSVEHEGFPKVLVDTIAARLVTVELTRLRFIESGWPARSAEFERLDRQQAALQQLLSDMAEPKAAQAYARRVVLRAVEARLASVTVERRMGGLVLPPDHPNLRALDASTAILERRRAELRALDVGAASRVR